MPVMRWMDATKARRLAWTQWVTAPCPRTWTHSQPTSHRTTRLRWRSVTWRGSGLPCQDLPWSSRWSVLAWSNSPTYLEVCQCLSNMGLYTQGTWKFTSQIISCMILYVWVCNFLKINMVKGCPHIWQNSMENFSKGDPLLLLKWWNQALWLVQNKSCDLFPGLSLAESIVCSFLYPLGVSN